MCPGDLTDSCYQDTNGGFCKADSVSIEDDPDVNLKIFYSTKNYSYSLFFFFSQINWSNHCEAGTCCERYRLITGLDEGASQFEIGLYFDFNVTETGIPYGCPGLETYEEIEPLGKLKRPCSYKFEHMLYSFLGFVFQTLRQRPNVF